MNGFTLLLFLHVTGAIAWIGSGIGLLMLNRQLIRAEDHAVLVAVGGHSQALGTRLFMPASLLTLATGIAMVATQPAFRFTDLWILIGFGGIALSGAAQMAVAEPANKRYLALVEAGASDSELVAAARRVSRGGTLDVGVLLVVVWAMIAKPSL